MALALISAPQMAPVSLDEIKRHLRVETDDDDVYLADLLIASIAHLEAVVGIKLITQTWRQYLDSVPVSGCFSLKVHPAQSIAGFRYYQGDGLPIEVSGSALQLDAVSAPARLQVNAPVTTDKAFNGIEIDIVAGFGDTPLEVPDSLKRALLLLIAHAYEFRGAVPLADQPASEPHGFQTLIAPYRKVLL